RGIARISSIVWFVGSRNCAGLLTKSKRCCQTIRTVSRRSTATDSARKSNALMANSTKRGMIRIVAHRRYSVTMLWLSGLLNTADSTIDLRTGEGREPSRLDYITKQTAVVAAAPGSPHPEWTKFLHRITAGNIDLQAFLQRVIGYSLTGFTTEQKFWFGHG